MHLLRLLILIFLFSSQAAAQQVSIQMPQKHGYIGVPMKLVVVFENVQTQVDPTLPEIEGFNIKRLPGEQTSRNTTIINGKVTSSSTRAITFILTPTKEGVLTIPALTFAADDKNFQSSPRIITIEQPPTGGSLKVEISGTSGVVYLGQPIDVTLKIYIEAFTDTTLGITLEDRDMISMLRGDFGIFADAIGEGRLELQQVRGNTDAGIPTIFYVLSIQETTWPETTGIFEMEPITVLMDYPISLKQERGFGFFGRDSLKVDQSHLISSTSTMPSIKVLAPPSQDKPPWFSGAIGTYDFRVVAEPTKVKVGEPIKLSMRVTDLTSGPINLDFLSAPLLDRVPALTDNFRVPDRPLGGIVEGRTKTFAQSIRPRNDSMKEIPPLPMSSFDPISKTYKTVWTKSIPIEVEAVATVSALDVVNSSDSISTTPPTKLTEVEGGILANYTSGNLLESQTVSMTPLLIATIATPPLVVTCFIATLFYRKLDRKSKLSTKGRVKSATSTIKRAATLQGQQQIESISSALRELQHTQEDDERFANEIKELLERCEATRFGGLSDSSLVKDAETLVEALR
ncbi:MAG: BatD family protein [Phycisphaerales bacterium]|jgi:hypothetical protein|nr:BatD family protein [Phycisphaerales bacterium]